MNVTWNTVNRRFSSMRDIHFAAAEDKNTAVNHTSGRDQVTISQEGRDRLEVLADKVENQLSAMTKEDFMDMLKQWKSENQPELEADPYRKVDPDGSIARKTYFESYLGQLKDMEDTIKSYYADAYDLDIPAQERQWTYYQLRAMLTGSNVALNDPHALASSGGTKTVDEMDKIAKQAVKDKLDSLIKERETSIVN